MAPPEHDVVVFNHLPKAAGTSVRDSLVSALKPARSVAYLDLAMVAGGADFETLDPRAREQFVFDPQELPDADFVTGHISPGTTMARYPHGRHVTVLRNPQTRVISQWVHSRSLTDLDLRHWGTGDVFRAARWPLKRYLSHAKIAPNVDNTMTRFLTWPHPLLPADDFIADTADDELFDKAVRTLDAMVHVDVVENRNFITDLGAALGVELTTTRLNDRSLFPPVVPTDLASELDEETRAVLDHRTRIDLRIWRHVAERVLPGTDLDALLAADLDDSIQRYSQLPAGRPTGRLVRRAGIVAYRLKARFDPKLREYRS